MPDGRFLSKSIAHSEQVAGVSIAADYLFMRCIPHLDVEGRMPGNPQLIKAIAIPLRAEITAEQIPALLAELEDAGLIVWYHVGARQVLEFPGFATHQKGMKRDREAPSRHPSPSDEGAVRVRAASAKTPPPPPPASGSTPAEVRTSSPAPAEEVRLSKGKLSEVEVQVEGEVKRERREPRAPRYAHFGKPDCDRLYLAWQRFGTPDYGRFRRAFGPLFPEHPRYTVAQLEAAIGEAIDDATREKEAGKPYAFNALTPETFVQRVDYWVTEAATPLEVDGVPTEKALRILGAA